MDIFSLANQIVAVISFEGLQSSIARVEQLRGGDPNLCHCHSCITSAVAEANGWLAWMDMEITDQLGQPYRYAVHENKGQLYIELYILK